MRDLAAFEKFHAANPGVYRLFVRFTLEVIAAGPAAPAAAAELPARQARRAARLVSGLAVAAGFDNALRKDSDAHALDAP
jgi:hypothetical protein